MGLTLVCSGVEGYKSVILVKLLSIFKLGSSYPKGSILVTDGPATEIGDICAFFSFVIEVGLCNVRSSFLELLQHEDPYIVQLMFILR